MLALLLSVLPAWNHLHPLVVHFPIALLMIAPLFVLGGLILRESGRSYLIAGFLLMTAGTCGTFVAGVSGDAAGESAAKTTAIQTVLERHEEMAETTQIVFSVLTLAFGTILFLPRLSKKQSPTFARLVPGMLGMMLFLYAGGVGVLINTAHNGGRLVHELGIHGQSTAQPGSTASTGQVQRDRD